MSPAVLFLFSLSVGPNGWWWGLPASVSSKLKRSILSVPSSPFFFCFIRVYPFGTFVRLFLPSTLLPLRCSPDPSLLTYLPANSSPVPFPPYLPWTGLCTIGSFPSPKTTPEFFTVPHLSYSPSLRPLNFPPASLNRRPFQGAFFICPPFNLN